jgi:hypothetical protein
LHGLSRHFDEAVARRYVALVASGSDSPEQRPRQSWVTTGKRLLQLAERQGVTKGLRSTLQNFRVTFTRKCGVR